MNINIVHNSSNMTAGDLREGDAFVLNKAVINRPLETRCAYMVLKQHSRLEGFRLYGKPIVIVSLTTGRVSVLAANHPIIPLTGKIRLEVAQ